MSQKNKIVLRLKKPAEDGYLRDVCCISKCDLSSEVIDATHRYSTLDLPLCDKHWIKLCKDEESYETTSSQ